MKNLSREERKTLLLAVVSLGVVAAVFTDFVFPGLVRDSRFRSRAELYRGSLWEEKRDTTPFWYDFDPCQELQVADCTDEMETEGGRRHPMLQSVPIGGGGGGASAYWPARGIGPGDKAMCPVDECAVIPSFVRDNTEVYFTAKTTSRYKYMPFLGITSKVHVSHSD